MENCAGIMIKNNWVVYLIECRDGSIYCGATNDVTKRIKKHNAGKGSKYTRSRLPVTLLLTSRAMTKREALKLEYQVKKQKASAKVDYLKKIGKL